MNRSRLVAAFLIAPATPGLIYVSPALFVGTPLASAWTMLASVGIVAYAHALILGLPIAWLLSRGKALTLLRVVLAAFLIGALPFGSLMLYQESIMPPGSGYTENGVVLRDDGHLTQAGMTNAVLGVLQLGGLGAAAGMVWWFFAITKRREVVA